MIDIFDYSIEENEHLYGPGKRLVIWTQGCSIHCKGCINQHLWDFDKGKSISLDNLISIFNDQEIAGITLHGGEPLDQSIGISILVREVKQLGKTIILFTGYRFKELKFKAQRYIWRNSDIVIAGRYIESKRNLYLQFRGSTNQKVITHIGPYKNYFVKDGKTESIITINKNGSTTFRGFITDDIKKIQKEIIKKT